MKRNCALLIIAATCGLAHAKIDLVTLPERDSSQLTIYNSADLTLVREQRNLTLKQGYNWLQLSWSNTLIDPTSLSLQPVEQIDKINIRQLVYPARTKQVGQWLIHSEVAGRVSFEITYFTSGLSWRAFYMGTLSQDERVMSLKGYVRIANGSGEDYEEAQTRLIVGEVHILDQIAELARREHPYGSPLAQLAKGLGRLGRDVDFDVPTEGAAVMENFAALGEAFDLAPKEIRKEGLSEYFLYTIEGTETIPDQWAKRLLSLEADDIEVESLYKYDENRYGSQTIRFVTFANDEEHNLGDTPIPDGEFRIYGNADDAGHLRYVGGTSVKYIPVDEEVELNLGAARLVTVEPKLMAFKTENYRFDRNRDISGWDEIRSWQIEVTNTRELPVEIEITRGFSTSYWTMDFKDPDVQYNKYDATNARFTLAVPPRTKKTFEYTVTTYFGERREDIRR